MVINFGQVFSNTLSLQSYLSNVITYLTGETVFFSLILFTCLALVAARTIPGTITLMIAVPYFTSTVLAGRIYYKNIIALLFVAGMIVIFVYQNMDALSNFIRNNSFFNQIYLFSEDRITRLAKFKMDRKNGRKILKLAAFALLLMTLIGLILSFKPGDLPMDLFIGCLILISGTLYTLSRKIPIGSLIIVCLILMTSVAAVSKLTFYNNYFDVSFDETADFITNNGGDFNYSTWIFDENGAKYAMRYCLGYEVIVGSGANNPFSQYNSPNNYLAKTNFDKFIP